MIRHFVYRVSALFCLLLLLPVGGNAGDTLQIGVPYHGTINGQSGVLYFDNFPFDVPANTQSIRITLTNASGDLDILLKPDAPFSGQTGNAIWQESVYRSDGPTAVESIEVSTSSSPPLTAGRWYLGLANLNAYNTNFTLTVTAEGGGSSGSQAGSNGIPGGFTIADGSGGLAVVAFNFSSAMQREDVDDLFKLATQLMGSTGSQETLTVYTPDQIYAMGYDGSQLHDWLVGQYQYFRSYINVRVSEQQTTNGAVLRFQATEWATDSPGGSSVGTLELSKSLPLQQMLGLLQPGSTYLKVKTSDSGGNKRIELFFQETTSSAGAFLLAFEGDQSTFSDLLSSAMGSLGGSSGVASTLPHPGAGGVPAGFTVQSGNELGVVAFNFNDQFGMGDIDDWFGIGVSLLGQLGGQGALTLYSPDQLMGWGYNGSQLHSWLLGMLRDFSSYINISASRQTGVVRLDASMWSDTYPSGITMGAIEIADPPPLLGLASMLSTGERFIRIETSNSGQTSLNFRFYFLESASSSGSFIGGFSITQAFLQSIFSSLAQ